MLTGWLERWWMFMLVPEFVNEYSGYDSLIIPKFPCDDTSRK
jgi:hypothetical protein